MKKLFVLLILLSIFYSCNKNTVKILRVAHNQSIEHPIHLALLDFEKLIEEKTEKKFDVQIFPNELLGGQRETIELTQTGAIDLAVASISLLESFNPAYSVFNLPYLFDSREHYHQVLDDKSIMEEIYLATKKSGFVALTYFDVGSRNFYLSSGPVLKPSDLQGKKIRIQQSPTNIKMIKAFNAAATPISFGEVYTALQQKVIDGAENNELALTNNKHGEVAKFYSYSQHSMIPDILIINNKMLDMFNKKYPGLIQEASLLITQKEIDYWDINIEKAIETATKMGVKFFHPDVSLFKDKVMPIHEELTKNLIVKNSYDKIINKIYNKEQQLE